MKTSKRFLKAYESKKRNWRRKAKMVKNPEYDWADFKPRRDVGVYANVRTTFKHNGEVKWS